VCLATWAIGVGSGSLIVRIDVRVKRVYEQPEPDDGYRVLVDHMWPRGVSRERARIDRWARELAPSNDLRKWFAHDPQRFPQFQLRYRQELADRRHLIDSLLDVAREGTVTLVYAARDRQHNNAVVLQATIREAAEPRWGPVDA